MSGFGEWRAHAGIEDFGRGVALHIGREVAPDEIHLITALDADGPLVEVKPVVEGVTAPVGLRMPEDVAQALYTALDRVFGQENQDGKVEALTEALAVERSRVNAMLQVVLTPQSTIAHHRPEHQVG